MALSRLMAKSPMARSSAGSPEKASGKCLGQLDRELVTDGLGRHDATRRGMSASVSKHNEEALSVVVQVQPIQE